VHDDEFKRHRAERQFMVTLYDVPADALIQAVAEQLEGELEPPEWAVYAKSGTGREFPPEQPDFWYVRAASMLRTVAKDGPVGVKRLATRYGSVKEGSSRYRMAPRHSTTGSRNQLRTMLQQLEEAGYLERPPDDEGRVVSAAGQSLLDGTAGAVLEDLDRPELERYA
jgi:small subunit ribosomal protein S19e